MQENPEDRRLTPAQTLVARMALKTKMDSIRDSITRFADRKDLTGYVGATLSATKIILEMNDFLEETGESPGAAEARAILEEAAETMDATRYEGDQTDGPTTGQIGICSMTSQIIDHIAWTKVNQAMTALIADSDLSEEIRWSALAIGTAATHQSLNGEDIEESFQTHEWDSFAETKETLREVLPAPEQDPSRLDGDFRAATMALLRSNGIDSVTENILQRPGVIRDLIISMDWSKDHQTSLELKTPSESHTDAVLFKHDGRVWIKNMAEPFPKGFDAGRAMRIASEFMDLCQEPGRQPEDADWEALHRTGLSAFKAAWLGLHDVPNKAFAVLATYLTERLDEQQRDLPKHIMEILCGGDQDLQQHLLRGHLTIQQTMDDSQLNRVVRAARRGGMPDADLWTLIKLTGADPGQYGVSRPALDDNLILSLAHAASNAGIPNHAIQLLAEELRPRI